MKANAVSLCDNVLCSFTSHYELKTVLVKDKQVVLFENEEFVFEKKESWWLEVDNQVFECKLDEKLKLQINEFLEIEIVLQQLNLELLKTSIIPLKEHMVFGSGVQCDVHLDGNFEKQVVEISVDKKKIHYHVFDDAVCAINGKRCASTGVLQAPALLQVQQFCVFFAKDAVAYHGGLILRKDELPYKLPEFQQCSKIQPKYIPIYRIEDLSLREPEFCALPQGRHGSLLSMGPMLTMSFASLMSAWIAFQHSQNSAALIMPAVMFASSLFWPLCNMLTDTLKLRKLKQERKRKYLHECTQLTKQIQDKKIQIQRNLVSPEELKVEDFWQIRANHPQFLKLPLGTGKLYLPYQVIEHHQRPDISESQCQNALKELHEESQSLQDGLIQCDLQTHRCISFVASEKVRREYAEKIILSMTSMMSLSEVHYVLFSTEEQLHWDFRKTCLFEFDNYKTIIDESVTSANIQRLFAHLNLSTTVCFVMNQRLFHRISSKVRNQVKTVYFLRHDDVVPPVCTKVYHIRLDGTIAEDQIKLFQFDLEKRKRDLMNLKFHHSFRKIQQSDFFSFYAGLSVEDLLKKWKSDGDPVALLGNDEFGECVFLNLSEHQSGPHGLIGGTTGSGKSVLLLNLLLSLAVQCSPQQLQMVILDYKGGTLVQQLHSRGKMLPHLAGGLSNQSSMIGRALSAIRYESLRRQSCFSQATLLSGKTIASLEEYRSVRKLYPQLSQLASLLIVVDEFAELKREEPEFLKTLISLSRIGRSLGFHLILCTQKISGVVDDEITGNSRFRLALRTARPSESRELIGVDDAAYLKEPGEFIFECDHHLIKGKAPYCLAPYYPDRHHEVSLTDSCGHTLQFLKQSDLPALRQSEVLIEMIWDAAQQIQWKPASLWLEPMAPFEVSKWLKKELFYLGLADYPDTRSQKSLYLKQNQHLFLGYENENQKEALLKYALKQLLHLGENVYYVQMVSSLCPRHLCIGSQSDQLERLIKKLSVVQSEHTVLLLDDLSEFSEFFSSVSQFGSFLFKAVQRKIQVIALSRKPFNFSQTIMDQFEMKLIFSDLNDSETMQMFHLRRENCRIALKSQAYTAVNEKLCIVQLGFLSSHLKEIVQPLQIDYLEEHIKKPDDHEMLLGISVKSLNQVRIHEEETLIATGYSFVQIKKYCALMNLNAQMMDVIELNEKMTRKSIRDVTVLWIGPYFQYQTLMNVDPKEKVPVSYQEGVVVKDGTMELIRLYDE